MRRLLTATALTGMLLAAYSCSDEAKPTYTANIDPEKTPSVRTENVETLISDSGVTRYKIVTPLWLIFDESRKPSWKFPDGIHLVKFDTNFAENATIDADSALYLKNKQLWRLDGNVRIVNTGGVRFQTNNLFWDQRKHKIYSDSFIHIERPDRVLEGYGFTANERLTSYTVNRVSGIFPAAAFTSSSTGGSDSINSPQP